MPPRPHGGAWAKPRGGGGNGEWRTGGGRGKGRQFGGSPQDSKDEDKGKGKGKGSEKEAQGKGKGKSKGQTQGHGNGQVGKSQSAKDAVMVLKDVLGEEAMGQVEKAVAELPNSKPVSKQLKDCRSKIEHKKRVIQDASQISKSKPWLSEAKASRVPG
jgi:hypothetical protein